MKVRTTSDAITILPRSAAAFDELAPSERRAFNRGIAASERDYKKGRSYGPFKTHEAFISSLHEQAARQARNKTKRALK